MIRLPQVFGLTLCNEMGIDAATGQMSLLGVFHVLYFPQFPTSAHPFTVYTALYDGVGEGTMELNCTRLETEEDIYRYRRWFAFPGRGYTINYEIKTRKCQFPAPGRYRLTLLFDKQEVTSRYLDVVRLRGET